MFIVLLDEPGLFVFPSPNDAVGSIEAHPDFTNPPAAKQALAALLAKMRAHSD
jgi:hypothetical protein